MGGSTYCTLDNSGIITITSKGTKSTASLKRIVWDLSKLLVKLIWK